jgi:outer membrane protein assembly factor BamA
LNKYFLTKIIIILYLVFAILSQSAIARENETSDTDNQETVSKAVSPILIIDDITCIGNETTQCSFINKKYYQKIGDVLDPDEVIDAKLRLGTLIQFKYVNVFLKKGHQRGHVVVVFDIKEASNLQYDIGYQYQYIKYNENFDYCYGEAIPKNEKERIKLCDRNEYNVAEIQNNLFAKVTNFNFLGSGKELSFALSTYKYDKNSDHIQQPLIAPSYEYTWSTRYVKDIRTVAVQYYDPHLLNSPYYYFNAKIDAFQGKVSSSYSDSNILDKENNRMSTQYANWLSVGRRFGRHSFISLGISGDLENKINQSYFFTYGYNSENDVLFPTQGDKFVFNGSTISDGNRLGFSYKRHFNLSNQSAFSLGGKGTYSKQANDYFYSKELEFTLSANYLKRQVINQHNGAYSGWQLGVDISKKQGLYDQNAKENFHIVEINASYIHQTENMVYRLTLAVGLNEYQ